MINFTIGACSFLMMLFIIKLLYTPSENRYINIILALALTGRTGLNLVYIAADTGALLEFPLLLKLFNPLYYFIPSGMYLYIRGLIKQESKFRKIDLVHFSPFVFGFFDIVGYFSFPSQLLADVNQLVIQQDKYFYYYISGPLTVSLKHALKPLLHSVYFLLIVKLLYQKNQLKFSLNINTREKWILILIAFTFISHLLQLFQWYNHFLGKKINFYQNDQDTFIIFPVLALLGLIIFIFQHPDILYGHLYLIKKWQNNRETKIDKAIHPPSNIIEEENTLIAPKVSKEIMPYPLAVDYAKQLVNLMKEKKLYKEQNLQIIELANETNILVHHCSYVLNKVLGKNFRDWTNEFRVNHFIEIYKEQRAQKTIDALAKESGFKNTTTFYNAFKKATGLSPTQYFK
jgi:AraC-like DNA-binding protein